ncbi:hypothetical protein [Roseateles toxinivorans]|uniref:Uncharacterized protein n=1 Tax=Roseateles toxinivorans TaxID=270368 RepID=A0A4R6QLM7_9BURK|nr:hypothetical protein [Roseateles toxinivorans]TDP64277.1 hypothetical protein DES47_104566 [Roseateles toxinivorans]
MDNTSSTPVTDALTLWELLNRKGGLAPASHDASLVASLCHSLGVPAGSDIGTFLASRPIDVSSFLIAVLTALEPFGLMLSETLAMFERHGVKGSNDGMLVQFDFGQAEGKLGFDAHHFRCAMASHQALQQAVAVHLFDKRDLWQLREVLLSCLPPQDQDFHALPVDAPARAWLVEALAPNGWPYTRPAPLPPADAGNELRQAMAPVLMAAGLSFSRMARYADRERMLAAAGDGDSPEPGGTLRSSILEWGEQTFGYAQSDLLAWQLLRLCWKLFERHRAPSPLRAQLAWQIEAAIAQHSEQSIHRDPVRQLEDLLDLPWWQQRHQLYSVWLVTVVEAAVPPPLRFSLHPVDGRLEFAFKATHVADIDGAAAPIQLVAELYTGRNGVSLQGKSRQEGIQPDYVLTQTGVEEQVFYVLEAKQYRKPSRSNFAAALHDYAAVHPAAVVALANYGPMTPDLEASLRELIATSRVGAADELVLRCRPFGHVEPSRRDDVARLSADIRASLEARPLPMRPMVVIDASGSMVDQLPEQLDDTEVAALWAAIAHPGAQIVIINQERREEMSPTPSPQALIAAIRGLIRPGVGLHIELPPSQPHPAALLVTDGQGFEETRSQHFRYLAVLVLKGGDWPLLHAPRADGSTVERAFPGLAAGCALG